VHINKLVREREEMLLPQVRKEKEKGTTYCHMHPPNHNTAKPEK
jgi:hypothetical protein